MHDAVEPMHPLLLYLEVRAMHAAPVHAEQLAQLQALQLGDLGKQRVRC